MNRQAKRMMSKQKTTPQDRQEAAKQRRAVAVEGRKRTPPSVFLKEVRLELKKVAWPTRTELWSYTAVVLVAVLFLASLVFGLDFVFSKAIFNLLHAGG